MKIDLVFIFTNKYRKDNILGGGVPRPSQEDVTSWETTHKNVTVIILM